MITINSKNTKFIILEMNSLYVGLKKHLTISDTKFLKISLKTKFWLAKHIESAIHPKYEINCQQFHKTYTGETSRNLKTHIYEHNNDLNWDNPFSKI